MRERICMRTPENAIPCMTFGLFESQYVAKSAVFLIFLSKGYFFSYNCLREARKAVQDRKPLILVHEAEPRRDVTQYLC
eukprot:3975804-Pleurochrysis_carterae.AAC.8